MTTIRQIITDAYREGGLVQIGLTPEAEELDEGLRKLQSLIRSLYGNEMGNPYRLVGYGVPPGASSHAKWTDSSSVIDRTYVPHNTRLFVHLTSAKTVNLNPSPNDGDRFAVIDVSQNFASTPLTIDGNSKNIEGGSSIVLNEDGINREWIYRADLGEWVRITEITTNSQSPFPPEFDDFLITLLALRLNPRYQAQTAPETVSELQRMRRQFRARYAQTNDVPVEDALIRLPLSWERCYRDLGGLDWGFDHGITW